MNPLLEMKVKGKTKREEEVKVDIGRGDGSSLVLPVEGRDEAENKVGQVEGKVDENPVSKGISVVAPVVTQVGYAKADESDGEAVNHVDPHDEEGGDGNDKAIDKGGESKEV